MENVTYCLDADEELFEDNPDEYIRRDIEGSGMFMYNDIDDNMHTSFICFLYI